MGAALTFLRGKKTYLVAAAMIVYQIIGHALYGTPYDPQVILSALGISALRAGIAKVGS
jgi:hypothetical protein